MISNSAYWFVHYKKQPILSDMRLFSFLILLITLFLPHQLNAQIGLGAMIAAGEDSGLITVESFFSVEKTVERLTKAMQEKGLKIFNTIDHQKGAESIGETLNPTTLIIFGSPKVGTSLMKCSQTAGLDLPLKMLVWENDEGDVFLTYQSASSMAARHDAEDCPVVRNMTKALAGLATSATE